MTQSDPQGEEILHRLRQPGAPSVAVIAEETGIPKAGLCYTVANAFRSASGLSLSNAMHVLNSIIASIQSGMGASRKPTAPRQPPA